MKKIRTLTYDPDRETLAQAMRDALSQVLKETGLTLTPWELNKWRATRRDTAALLGLEVRVTILATDGNLAIFQRAAGANVLPQESDPDPVPNPVLHVPGPAYSWSEREAAGPNFFVGHIQRFTGEVAPLLSLAKSGGSGKTNSSPKSKKLTRAEKLAKL